MEYVDFQKKKVNELKAVGYAPLNSERLRGVGGTWEHGDSIKVFNTSGLEIARYVVVVE